MRSIKKVIVKLLNYEYARFSYAQEGEDLVFMKLVSGKRNGRYLDIGAHSPFRYSNTYNLYKLGWSGVNVEINEGSKKEFDKYRKRDINIEAAISNSTEDLIFYEFMDPALNTFSGDLALERISGGYELRSERNVKTVRIMDLFETYMQSWPEVDLLTIDIEGLDLEVLMSIDFAIFAPNWIIVENYAKSIREVLHSQLNFFLESKHYELVSKCDLSCIYKKNF